MRLEVIEGVGDGIFTQWDLMLDLYIKSYIDVFATIPLGIENSDIVEIIEYHILQELDSFDACCEIDRMFTLYSDKKYEDKHIIVLGELFLSDMIDFYLVDLDNQPTLSQYKDDKYQAWIYFRDNFIYKRCFNAYDFCDTSWDTPHNWSRYNINATITPKGTKYFKEVLAPKFYNKYKDLEVEVDDEGKVIRWIGSINR
ncbi:hypothetical protein [Campylobacter troglodytis]|uniref:hypothetical protein n=1 Tax=Campylobacter troglodytis TaxID=654363 RepID=UPI00115967DB|nr:hypothetical protein [Campylobacter troglodytis]